MSLVDSALIYAAQGWPVFPCNPRTKQPLVKGDIDPATKKPIPKTGGLKKATTDAETIRGWWRRWPKAMIGLACGNAAGVFVLDVDAGEDKETGEVFTLDGLLAQLRAELGEDLPSIITDGANGAGAGRAWTVATPRGGRHFYFRMPHDGFGNGRGKLPDRFDVRGEGGYVILPPSQRDDGKAYEWLVTPMPGEQPRAAPRALLDCITRTGRWQEAPARAPALPSRSHYIRPAAQASAEDEAVARYAQAALDGELHKLADAVDGSRNNTLNEAAFAVGQLVGGGALTDAEAAAALQRAVAGWNDQPKCLGTIERGMTAGKAKPRDLAEVRSAAAERAARYASAPPDAPPPDDVSAYGGADRTLPQGQPSQTGKRDSGPAAMQRPRRFAPEDPDELNLRLAFFPMTDLGNAERFRERNKGRLLYCRELDGLWLWWDGRRWNREGAATRAQIAEHETVRAIKDEALALRQSGKDVIVGMRPEKKKKPPTQQEKISTMVAVLAGQEPEAMPAAEESEAARHIMLSDLLEGWAQTSEAASGLSPIAKHGSPYLAVSARELDADRLALNVLNGTLRFGRDADGGAVVRFGAHDPDDLITKLAPVVYDPRASCPYYDEFLQQVQPNRDNRRFLHQWGGYALTGDVSEQRLVFLWGKGRNGKSTLVDVWGLCAGEYGTATPIETFLAEGRGRQGNQASPDLAMLKGVRFVRTSEPDKGAKLGEALIKLVTGGEPFPARELHKPFFMLFPQFKLTISGNYRPKIVGTDEGIWRRVTLVPWTVTIDKDKVDKALGHKLALELSGIFNRLLDGLRDWLDNGLIIPVEVEEATAEYRRDSDPLGRFLDACVVADPGGQEQSSVLHKVFCAWCKANGEREWTATGFGLAMSDRGFHSKKSNVSWWLNIKLIKSESDFVDGEGRALVKDKGNDDQNVKEADDEVPI